MAGEKAGKENLVFTVLAFTYICLGKCCFLLYFC